MRIRFYSWLTAAALILSGCAAPESNVSLTVAAASNLTGAFDEIAAKFREQTGTEVVLSYGSTAQLSQQIEAGAPFDVFAAADTEHVDQLISTGKLTTDTRAVYARGQLALWIPKGDELGVRSIKDLTKPEIRFIALAQPELAPYGEAAVQALKASALWDQLQPKVVYAGNINLTRQFAATGNADAAFTAFSLVRKDPGTVLKIDPALYQPLNQALAVLTASQHPQARRFASLIKTPEYRAILTSHGYLLP